MMPRVDALQPLLRSLRLGGMADALPLRLAQARTGEIDHLRFLWDLVEDEMNKRSDRLHRRRLSAAAIPMDRSLEGFDWTFNPSVPRRVIQELSTSEFVRECRDVLFVGPPGVGKTHLCCALARSAVAAGYKVLWRNVFDLAEEMRIAALQGKRREMVAALVTPQLLVLDELGMKSFSATTDAEDLLEVIHRRHGKASTMIATNRPIAEWGTLLGDAAAAGAIIDRILESATVINLKGAKSHRTRKLKAIGDQTTEQMTES
jgi:DNA replication protein DnaC